MRTITVRNNGYVFRWAGGTFVAVWEETKAHLRVPHDMIQFPESVNRSKAGHREIHTLACEYAGAPA